MICDLLLLDAKYLLFKGAYAFKELTAIIGEQPVQTGATFGLLRQIMKIHDTHGGELVMVWDSTTNYRRELLPTYKRHKTSPKYDDLVTSVREQESVAIKLLALLGIRQAQAEGFEADDVMYSLAKKFAGPECHAFIFTGDEDLLQAIGKQRTVVLSKPKQADLIVDEAKMLELKGLTPQQFSDAKCLSGCNSDNVPGVPGVGAKYATRIIQEFGNLTETLQHARVPSERWAAASERIRKLVVEHEERVRQNVKLIRLADCVDEIVFFPNVRDIGLAQRMLTDLNFKTLLIDSTFNKLLSMGVPKSNEFVCPRGGKRYGAERLAEMCSYYLAQEVSPVLGNEYCKNECSIPPQLHARLTSNKIEN